MTKYIVIYIEPNPIVPGPDRRIGEFDELIPALEFAIEKMKSLGGKWKQRQYQSAATIDGYNDPFRQAMHFQKFSEHSVESIFIETEEV